MATLLLELFSEEIPSRMQAGAAEQLQHHIHSSLVNYKIATASGDNVYPLQNCKTFVSPRHLAIQCLDLPLFQPEISEERRGPKTGAPEQAIKGFLLATGQTLEQCEQRNGHYYATITYKSRPMTELLKEICEHALAAFSWPKSMRWGNRPLSWVRPLHRIVCLLDDAVVPVQFAHLTASNITEGHRFLAPAPIMLTHAEQYESGLAGAKVIVDRSARRAKIAAAIAALATAAKLQVVEDDALLDEVTGLVEWPVPLLGSFDTKFLDLPPEVLISEMKVHQRYFALQDAGGKLTNQFIAVANMETADGGKAVIAGNARVLRARLSDGEFYWQQDQKTSLADWGKKLSDVVFHAKVGMMNEKVARIEALAVQIAEAVGFKDTAAVRRAAQLCKADLTSGMVGEFPELQGIMGRYYALAQGEKPEIADAIRDHYKPLGASDSLPESDLTTIIALADKLDSIVSLFAAGEKPTGSKDPLALRRAALGVLRILLNNEEPISLTEILRFCSPIFDSLRSSKLKAVNPSSKLLPADEEIINFFRDRLKQVLRDENIRHDIIEATMLGYGDFTPITIRTCAMEITDWLATPPGQAALAAIKRALNILAAEEKKSKQSYSYAANKTSALTQPSEQALLKLLQGDKPTTPQQLEAFTAPINAFFDAVLVTEPEFRDARLSLLAGVREASRHVADFSKIEG